MSQELKQVPVSQIPLSIADNIIEASHQGVTSVDGDAVSGYVYMEKVAENPLHYAPELKTFAAMCTNAAVAFAGLTITGLGVILAPFASMASFVMTPFFGSNRIVTIMILNALDKELKLHEVYQAHGVQTAEPVYNEIIPGSTEFDDKTKNLIPGRITPAPGLDLYGLGIYRFEKDLDLGFGVRGTMGAISFTSTDPALAGKTIAISWMLGQDDSIGYAVTLDLGQYGTLQDFYEKTAGKAKQTPRMAHEGSLKIHSSMMLRQYDINKFEADQKAELVRVAKANNNKPYLHVIDQMTTKALSDQYMQAHKSELREDLVLTVSIVK